MHLPRITTRGHKKPRNSLSWWFFVSPLFKLSWSRGDGKERGEGYTFYVIKFQLFLILTLQADDLKFKVLLLARLDNQKACEDVGHSGKFSEKYLSIHTVYVGVDIQKYVLVTPWKVHGGCRNSLHDGDHFLFKPICPLVWSSTLIFFGDLPLNVPVIRINSSCHEH